MKWCALAVVLCWFAVLQVYGAPQRSIDFLLGDEELQAVVKPLTVDVTSVQPLQDEQDELQQREQPELPATVDPVENELQTDEPTADTTEDYAEEEQFTADPQDESALDPVTDSPKQDPEPSSTEGKASESTTMAPKLDTSTSAPSVTSEGSPKVTTLDPNDSEEDHSSEEQLTTNPIVVPESEEPVTTESSEDSSQLAQDVNDFIFDLTNEVRTSQTSDKPRKPLVPKPVRPQPTTEQPATEPEGDRYDSKSAESDEDDGQVQLKVDPGRTQQPTNGPPLTEEQFRSLLEKLPWFGQQRFPAGYDQQWQHQGFPQRSSWQRDDRQRHYQSHDGSDGFQGHGFHRGPWH
ncbi:proteoglycan 4-like [Anopheles nili]|uniref:proteoglycan 4-like n=1 Tax=Anopheles nili TaxID=185578 RepID=UPI00237AFC26|nr:proteoglycan 4-like [Anopheles nili]